MKGRSWIFGNRRVEFCFFFVSRVANTEHLLLHLLLLLLFLLQKKYSVVVCVSKEINRLFDMVHLKVNFSKKWYLKVGFSLIWHLKVERPERVLAERVDVFAGRQQTRSRGERSRRHRRTAAALVFLFVPAY